VITYYWLLENFHSKFVKYLFILKNLLISKIIFSLRMHAILARKMSRDIYKTILQRLIINLVWDKLLHMFSNSEYSHQSGSNIYFEDVSLFSPKMYQSNKSCFICVQAVHFKLKLVWDFVIYEKFMLCI
jgi:hypothetical protein